MPIRRLAAAICVPARNEAVLLPRLLESLAALDIDGIDPAVFIQLDGCTDDTAAVIGRIAATLPFRVETQCAPSAAEPNAGRARRAAMAQGLPHATAHGDGILLTTDADSRPHAGWLQAAWGALGIADVAAGRLVRTAWGDDPIQTRIERYYDRLHRYRRTIDSVPWDAAPGHHFTGGANLAFRASAYLALGGFRPIPSGEDATALDDAARAGLRVRREAAMVVETSSRRDGRAAAGLAAALRAIDAGGLPEVSSPAGAAWQYRAHAHARQTFAQMDSVSARTALGLRIGLDADHILGVARDCPNPEAFAMRVVPAAPLQQRVPLIEAELALAEFEHAICDQAA